LRAITKEVERLEALSGQYLSVAKRRELRRDEGNAGEIIKSACEFMRGDVERHGVALDVQVEDDLPLSLVDEAQLKQVLFNLVRNARESMDRGGTIKVSVHEVERGVEITVDDEGGGIDKDVSETLFDPFFSTKSHGTGLGLAITRQVVEAHGGSVRCEPLPERGTRFAIVLPGIRPDRIPPEQRAIA
jgi:signal transduction histidine kinase